MDNNIVPIVVLAAGESKRFDGCKQTAQDNSGILLIERSIKTAVASEVGPVCVVLGARANAIKTVLKASIELDALTVFENPNWSAGLGNSIAFTINAIEEKFHNVQGTILLLADQVEVIAEDIRDISKLSGADAVGSTYQSTIGPPCYFPKDMFNQLKMLEGERGAKALLLAENTKKVSNPRAAIDIDTQTQWQHWLDEDSKNA